MVSTFRNPARSRIPQSVSAGQDFWLHEFINDVKSGTLKLESSKYADMKVHVADAEMTVVTYRSTDKGTYKSKDISGHYRWIDVFAKRGGRWQVVVSQGTKIATQ